MDIKFANNASSRLLDNIDANSTSFSILPDTGILFPVLESADDYFMITVVNPGDATYEIMKCTGIRGDLLTVQRAQEGTLAREFPQNSIVDNRLTAKSIEKILNDADATENFPGRVTIASEDSIFDGIDPLAAITVKSSWILMVPPGTVIPYAGSFDEDGYVYDTRAGKTRKDWHRCDGTYGTIDLRDRFVMGGGGTYHNGAIGGKNEVEVSVTAKDCTLTVDQIPSHDHQTNLRQQSSCGYHCPGYGIIGRDIDTSNLHTTKTGGGKPHTHDIDPVTVNILPTFTALTYIQKIA